VCGVRLRVSGSRTAGRRYRPAPSSASPGSSRTTGEIRSPWGSTRRSGSRLARERTVVVEKTAAGTPVLVERDEQPYVGIISTVTMRDMGEVLPPLAPRVYAWLADRGISPSGPCFWRYAVVDMAGELEVGRRPRVSAGRRRWRGEGRCVASWPVRGCGARRASGHPRAGDAGIAGLGRRPGAGVGRHRGRWGRAVRCPARGVPERPGRRGADGAVDHEPVAPAGAVAGWSRREPVSWRGGRRSGRGRRCHR